MMFVAVPTRVISAPKSSANPAPSNHTTSNNRPPVIPPNWYLKYVIGLLAQPQCTIHFLALSCFCKKILQL